MIHLTDPTVGVLILALTSVQPSLPVYIQAAAPDAHEISHIDVSPTGVTLHGGNEDGGPLTTDRNLMHAHLTTVSILCGILQSVPKLHCVAIQSPTTGSPRPLTAVRQSTLAQTVLLSSS
jgi:hypothetical protein